MIKIIPAQSRHFNDFGWLKTYWLFSFNSYRDPDNMQFGSLRVFNDDRVAPGKGFDMHAHREMEIVSVILSGAITHEDSIGNRERIKAGEVQVMLAGTGIRHSEYNLDKDELRLYQVWFLPNKSGLQPSYQQKDFSSVNRKNRLLPVASGRDDGEALYISTNSTLYLGSLDKDQRLQHTLENSNRCFVYVTSGNVKINDTELSPGDQARIENEDELAIVANDMAEFVMAEMW